MRFLRLWRFQRLLRLQNTPETPATPKIPETLEAPETPKAPETLEAHDEVETLQGCPLRDHPWERLGLITDALGNARIFTLHAHHSFTAHHLTAPIPSNSPLSSSSQ